MDKRQFFSQVLSALNIPVSEGAINFLVTWSNYEKRAAGKPHGFNPLNTTKDISKIDPKQTNFNTNAGYPVKNYSSQAFGVKATADTLKLPYYKNIVALLKDGTPPELAFKKTGVSRELRTWGTHTLANKFIDAAESKKPTKKDNIKSAKDASGLIKTIAVLFLIGGLIIFSIKFLPIS